MIRFTYFDLASLLVGYKNPFNIKTVGFGIPVLIHFNIGRVPVYYHTIYTLTSFEDPLIHILMGR